MFELAQTVWPRFGGDRANRSLLSIPGPHEDPTWRRFPLPTSQAALPPDEEPGGIIVMPDETLRVCHAGMLSAVKLDGTILWQLDLSSLMHEYKGWSSSLPTALQTGETILLMTNTFLMIDTSGSIRRKDELACADDSGFPPNLTYSGLPVASGITGEVYVLKENMWQEIMCRGYDIVTPAIYPDNSLAVAGFAGPGFCRTSIEGEIQWTTHLKLADLLPTLNHEHIAAIGSLNEKCSAFFRANGEQIGEYPYPATFAVYPDGGWVALSKRRLARLTLEGQELWGREICRGNGLSFVEQPIVDKDGFVYIRQKESFLCCDPQGRTAFEVKLPASSQGPLSIIAPRVMAYVMDNELFIGYN